jgi:hypothetical protein
VSARGEADRSTRGSASDALDHWSKLAAAVAHEAFGCSGGDDGDEAHAGDHQADGGDAAVVLPGSQPPPNRGPPAAQYGAATADPSADHQARVIEVIDGDTIRVMP